MSLGIYFRYWKTICASRRRYWASGNRLWLSRSQFWSLGVDLKSLGIVFIPLLVDFGTRGVDLFCLAGLILGLLESSFDLRGLIFGLCDLIWVFRSTF